MKLAFGMGYAPPGTNPTELIALAQEAERLGYDSAWAAEAWGTDTVSVLSWLAATTTRLRVGAAIMQIPGRTPAATAMTAATLDLMSGGRFLLGLGTSGPQVAEGWHGEAWAKPLARTREYVDLVRRMLRREAIEHHGDFYDIPYTGPDATGLGIPLKLMMRPLRSDIPVYLAAMGPKNIALAGEIADGWLPFLVSPERFAGTLLPPLREGLDRAGKTLEGFDIAATHVPLIVSDDLESAREAVKPVLALYVGGMGARGKNFYFSLVSRYGFEAEAKRIQNLYLEGKQRDAAAAVPDSLVDEVALLGSRERIADRLEAWRECGITTMIVRAVESESLRVLAELVL